MYLNVENLSKKFGKEEVLKDISFSAGKGEFLSLIGPSGVGKTTLLKILAGIETQDSGTFRFTSDMEKPVVLVFQDYILFPFLTVFENIAFGLRAKKLPKNEIREKTEMLIAHFGLSNRAAAYPAEISAGQRQRTALARALAVEPGVLLLDEPFANLDKNLKRETAFYIKKIQQDFNITMICVTHDQEEAMAVSDRIGVLLGGQLMQIGAAEEVFYKPVSSEVGCFMGPLNVLPGRFVSGGKNDEKIFIRPENLGIIKSEAGRLIVNEVSFLGLYMMCTAGIKGEKIELYTSQRIHLNSGDKIDIEIAMDIHTWRKGNKGK